MSVQFTCPACLEFGYGDEGNECATCQGDGRLSIEEFTAWRDAALEDGFAAFTYGSWGEVAWASRNRDGWLVRLRTYAAPEERSLVVPSLEEAVEAVRRAFKVPATRPVAA